MDFNVGDLIYIESEAQLVIVATKQSQLDCNPGKKS